MKQNEKFIAIADKKACKVFLLEKSQLGLIKSIGEKGPGPLQFERIDDIYLTEKYLYVFDGIHRKVVAYNLDGTYKKLFQLFVRGQKFAVDEDKQIFVINGKGYGNVRFVNMKTGKLVSYGNLPDFGNEYADKLYMWESIPIVTKKYYFFVRKFFPEVIVLNKKFVPVKNIVIYPPEKHWLIEKFNDNLNNIKEGLQALTFGAQLHKKNIVISNVGYITQINTENLSQRFFITYRKPTAEEKSKDMKLINPSFEFFYTVDDFIYLNNSYEDFWYKYNLN